MQREFKIGFYWLTPKQAAEEWGISDRRVQALCANGQITGVIKLGQAWLIPSGTPKPSDGRSRNGRKPTKNKQEDKQK